jgi:hypothetical protein
VVLETKDDRPGDMCQQVIQISKVNVERVVMQQTMTV